MTATSAHSLRRRSGRASRAAPNATTGDVTSIHFKKSRMRLALNLLNPSCSNPGLPSPHAQRIDPALKTLAPAGERK